MAPCNRRNLESLSKRKIKANDIDLLRLTDELAKRRLAGERQQNFEKDELELKSTDDFRDYFRALPHWGSKGYIIPAARNWIELEALVLNALAARKAAYKDAPSARPVPIEVALAPEFQREFREATIFLEENIRCGGNRKSAHAQSRMVGKGVDKLSNAKGAMLVALRDGHITVCRDGLNSLTAHINQDEAEGIDTYYYFRLHVVDPDEDTYTDHLLDDHFGRRGAKLTMQLIDSKGRKLTGWVKERTFTTIKQLVCFDNGHWDNSHEDTDYQDALLESYLRHRTNIEWCLEIPWLLSHSSHKDNKGFLLKPVTLATLVYALYYYRHDPEALGIVKQFIQDYGLGNQTSGNKYVDAMRDFIDNPYDLSTRPEYNPDRTIKKAGVPLNNRGTSEIFITVVSLWIKRAVDKADVGRGKGSNQWLPRKTFDDRCAFKNTTHLPKGVASVEDLPADKTYVDAPVNVLREFVKQDVARQEALVVKQRSEAAKPGVVKAGVRCPTTAEAIIGRGTIYHDRVAIGK